MLRCRWLDELRRQQRLARRATNRKSICCGESGTSTTNGYASNLHVLAKDKEALNNVNILTQG